MLANQALRHQMVLPEQQAIYDYWRSCCRQGALPARKDLDPAEFIEYLPHISLTEVRKDSSHLRFQYRLAGTGFWKFFGQEIQGAYIDELPIGDRRDYWERVLKQVTLRRRPTAGVTRPGTPQGGHLAQFWIRLPLSENGHDVNLILGYDHFVKLSKLDKTTKDHDNNVYESSLCAGQTLHG